MKRNTLNFVIDLVSFAVMLGLILTGIVMKFVLPPGTGGRYGGARSELWGMGRHDWGAVHFWLAVGVLALLILHVALHWNWVTGTLRRLFRPEAPAGGALGRNLYGIGFLLVCLLVIGGFWWIADAGATKAPAPGGQRQSEHEEHPVIKGPDGQPVHIRGRMTLSEVSQATRIPVERLIEVLGLPADAPRDRGLGSLDVDMSAARRLIAQEQARR